jgi:Cdc6-like AAA superfamily ATPase
MAKLTNLEKANDAARALPQTVNKNKHFAIPKAVESHYLGRETELNTLAQAFWPKDQVKPHRQKRYVISGVGGSGKTQFCGKYAQEFRDRYVLTPDMYIAMYLHCELTDWARMQLLGCFLGRRGI